MRMAIGFKFYEEQAQFRPAEPAAGKAWWREGREATLRQTHDTYNIAMAASCMWQGAGHHEGIKIDEDRLGRGVRNWLREGVVAMD